MRYLRCGASLVALLTAAPALAQDEAHRVEEIVATGTLRPEGVRADEIGGSVTVITDEDLEQRQVRYVSDVLRDVPGVAVSRAGQPGATTQIRIRGAEGNHTLTLIDGVEANDPFQGEFDYATLIAEDAARVEVLRGQQSALYGSDAIAGVVHYITASGREQPGLSLRAEGGSFNTASAALRLGGYRDALDWSVSAGLHHTGGYPTQTDGLGRRDVGADVSTIGGKASFRASDAVRLRGVVRLNRTDGDANHAPFPDSLVVDTPGAGYESQSLYWLGGADIEALEGLWTHTLQVQGVDAWRDTLTSNLRSERNEGARFKASYATTYRVEGERLGHFLTGAVDYERETYTNGLGAPKRRSDNTGYVLDYRLEIGRGSGFGASVRQDENDLFQDATTYRVQAYHSIGDALRLRAAAGTGIKNPTFFELFGFGTSFVGNPLLKPEESRGWEAGADLTLHDGRLRAGFTWFNSELENEIFAFFGGTPPPGCPAPEPGRNTVCNRASTSTQKGLELYATAELQAGVSVAAAYTHLDAEENGVQEIRRPPHMASANLSWNAEDGRFGATLSVRYQGRNQDSNFSILTPDLFDNDPPFTPLPSPPHPFGRVELPAFTLVNLAGRWAVNDQVEVFGRVENLFDEDYWEVLTFRPPGRAFYAGVRGRF